MSKIERLTKLFEMESDATNYNKKSRDINIKSAKLVLNLLKRIDIHNLNVEQRNFTLDQMRNLSTNEKKCITYYEVRIDCYYKNKIGNEVLGQFSFPFNADGLVGTLDKVVHINK